jgi:hypothetical protein
MYQRSIDRMNWKTFSDRIFKNDITILIVLSLTKLLIHFVASGRYGYFRDELYYIACGENLDFGYVDHPPFIAIVTKLSRLLLGDSLFALRFFPAVAGALALFLTGLIVRELGGKRAAIHLAAVAVLIAPILLAINGFLSMNAFDHLFWTLSAFVLILILKTKNDKLWLVLGAVLGLGLQNKHSIFFFGFGLLVGLSLTQHRKYLYSTWLSFGALVAFVIFIPHLIWQLVNGWPSIEFIKNASRFKNLSLSPLEFLFGMFTDMHPFCFPILFLGLIFFLFSKYGKDYRVFGWMFLAIFALFMVTRAKTYYIAPLYPVMFAAGAVGIEKIIDNWNIPWLKTAMLTFLLGGGVLAAPLALPLLPVRAYISYSDFLGFSPPRTEDHPMGVLPQHFADMFGWPEMTEAVAKVYLELPDEDREICGIFTQNYGEAGAIDFFGHLYSLPKAISGHNNYWIWGPRSYTGEVMIIIGGDPADHMRVFDSVEQAGLFTHDYVMPYENNLPIFVCRKPRVTIEEIWPQVKHFE